MGVGLGASGGGTNSSSTGMTANTYSPTQTGVQNLTGTTLASDLTAANAGTLTPGTTAEETSAADQINKTSAAGTNRVTQFLASRGFGPSGQTGQAGLAGELARESSLGTNAATFAGQQNIMNSNNLLAALNYAFQSLGSTGASTGSSSSWGVSAGAGGAVPGFH